MINIISRLKQTFEISSENAKSFSYVGINIQQHANKDIQIDQNAYIESIEPIKIEKGLNQK